MQSHKTSRQTDIHQSGFWFLVQVDLKDLESATVLAYQYIVTSPHLMKGAASRQALKDFTDLTANAHPTKLCAPNSPFPQTTRILASRATVDEPFGFEVA